MSSLIAQINQAVKPALEYFPDRCDVVSFTSASAGFGGTTETPNTGTTDIRCFYEVFSQPRQVVIAGSGLTTLSHRLVMEATAETRAIKPHMKIVVAARDDMPALTFLNPVPLDGSIAPLVVIGATLQI